MAIFCSGRVPAIAWKDGGVGGWVDDGLSLFDVYPKWLLQHAFPLIPVCFVGRRIEDCFNHPQDQRGNSGYL